MGLFDKLGAALAGRLPDYTAEISALAGPDDAPLASVRAFPSAYTRAGDGGSLEKRLLSAAISTVQNKVSTSRHVSGEAGSTARGLEQSGDLRVLALGARSLTWWDFGVTGTDAPPTLRQRLDRALVTSLIDTGERAQGGAQVARLSFTDGSWFDYRFIQPADGFWEIAAAYPLPAAD